MKNSWLVLSLFVVSGFAQAGETRLDKALRLLGEALNKTAYRGITPEGFECGVRGSADEYQADIDVTVGKHAATFHADNEDNNEFNDTRLISLSQEGDTLRVTVKNTPIDDDGLRGTPVVDKITVVQWHGKPFLVSIGKRTCKNLR